MSRVLVTGAAGYIGSHCVVELLATGHAVVGVDDFSNSDRSVIDTLDDFGDFGDVTFVEADVRDRATLARVMKANGVEAVVHLAGVKSVAESMVDPLRYWSVNVEGTVALLLAMQDTGVGSIVFSSSCTVYGEGDGTPARESDPIAPTSTYGRTKAAAEQAIRDAVDANDGWHAIALRYFNPAGAHPSGRLGDDPTRSAPNLIPASLEAARRGGAITINGDDYPTDDGTCERDYVHIVDLARGHAAALDELERTDGFVPINLGTGERSSVREVIETASEIAGMQIASTLGPRRIGDAVSIGADPTLAWDLLEWKAELGLTEMCASHWAWMMRHDQHARDQRL